jgi:hypothetical protein
LIGDAEALRRTLRPDTSPSTDATAIERVTLLGLPAHTEADRLALEMSEAKILVGRWAPPSLADEQTKPIVGAGAVYVSSTLLEAREQL